MYIVIHFSCYLGSNREYSGREKATKIATSPENMQFLQLFTITPPCLLTKPLPVEERYPPLQVVDPVDICIF